MLPELRRAQIINSTDIQGNTDAEILEAVRNGRELTVEEYLYAAEELAKDPEQQVKILTIAVTKYNDARLYNNLGVALTKMGANDLAMKAFEKAASLDASSAELNKNLLLANLASGKTAEAKKYAASVDAEAKAALAAAEGNYNAAAGLQGYNAAVVAVMNNDLTTAKRAIAQDKSADADYLRAVIAAKQGDLAAAKAELKSATQKNPELAAKAKKDVLLREVVK